MSSTAVNSPPSSALPQQQQQAPVEPNDSTQDKDHAIASPPPAPPKLPEVAITSPSFSSPPTATNPARMDSPAQAPAQLALLLSNALADADALRRALADEKKRAARAERLLSTFHPAENGNGASEEKKLPEEALKAILDAEARAERAERARDDALHALRALAPNFTDLERYESALELRASDARNAFARHLNSVVASHPPPAASPTLSQSRSPEPLALPGIPPPLPAPTTNGQYLTGPGTQSYSSSSSPYTRALPSHANGASPFSFSTAPPSYPSHSRQNSNNHAQSPFSGLPLPPPPAATGLGTSHVPPPPSTSSSFSVPAKRAHRSRSTRTLEEGSRGGDVEYESKRRRVGVWEEGEREGVEEPLPYPQHQPPLSAHPTQRVYERSYARSSARGGDWDREANGYAQHSVNGHTTNGLGRVDARQLVRDAKERERQGVQPLVRHNKRGRGRSASRSSGSSWSIDEMLLETATATDRERGIPLSPSAHRSPPGVGRHQYSYPAQSFAPPNAPLPPSASNATHAQLQVEDSYPKKAGSHSSQTSSTSAGEKERNGASKVPATQLVTLGPGGVVVSGGGPATTSYPPHNVSGQRICRQCGVPGRYKEGKCVEKWGPGPEGPGTVCDRCRKKMKRVERRGTLDSASASAQQQSFISHRQSQNQNQLQAHPTLPVSNHATRSPSTNRTRAITHTDTLLVDHNSQGHPSSQVQTQTPADTQSTMLSQSQGPAHLHAYSRERERDVRRGRGTSRSRSPLPSYHPSERHSQSQYSQGHSKNQSQSQGQEHRRAPTPPYINSISTREQYEDDGEGEDVDDASGEMDVDAEIAQAAGTGAGAKGASRIANAVNINFNGVRRALNGAATSAPGSSRASSAASASASALDKSKGARSNLSGVPASAAQQRDMVDELDEDDVDADAEADADIMDAVDATMKVEE